MKSTVPSKYIAVLTSLTFCLGFTLGHSLSIVRADMRGSRIFPDVTNGAYYDDAVGEMYGAGVITGYDDGRFGPDDFVTRGQVAVMMQRFRKTLEGSVSSSSSSTTRQSSSSSAVTGRGKFRFTKTSFSISESAPTASITVERTDGKTGVASVTFYTVDGTATQGEDYTSKESRLDFDDDEEFQTIEISIKNDEIGGEDNENFKVRLKDPTNGAGLDSPTEMEIVILDNDGSVASSSSSSSAAAGEQGAVGFSALEYAISETDDEITIRMVRTDGSKGAVDVDYAANKKTADNGDFGTVSGTMTFDDGQTEKSFSIPIYDNSNVDGNKTVELTLTNPAGGVVLDQSTALLTILDDEIIAAGSGTLKFGDDSYDASEGDSVVIDVVRTGGTSGEASIEYDTENSTAKSGSDFEDTSGTLTFKEGESKKTFTVDIIEDDSTEPVESASLRLTNPSGASLGTPSSAQLSISD